MPQSVLTWVQFAQEDLDEANKFLKEISTPEAIDELGFGRIRDYYSDRFFPATSTIMTHVRYLIFLPALIETASFAQQPEQNLERLQHRVCKALLTGAKETKVKGIIGATAGEYLQRFPAEIYWSALRDLNIIHRRCTLRKLLSLQKRGSSEPLNDEGGHDLSGTPSLIDEHALELSKKAIFDNKDIKQELFFSLEPDERKFLANRYRTCKAGVQQSVLAHLLDNPEKFNNNLWSISIANNADLKQALSDAAIISILAMGCYLIYGCLLVRNSTNGKSVLPTVEKALDYWLKLGVVKKQLSTCQMDDILLRLGKNILRPGLDDAGFIKRMHGRFTSASGAEELIKAAEDDTRRRELNLKSTRARLGPKKTRLDELELKYYTELYQPWPYWTDYRWPISRVFFNELTGGKYASDT